MTEASIPVDLLNPGQVFACIGFLEAADVLLGEAMGVFDWSEEETRFHLRARGEENPFACVLRFLDRAEARAVAVSGSPNVEAWKGSWGPIPSEHPREEGYPFPDPSSPATLVCELVHGEHRIRLDHWGDETRDNVKFWAGSGGYPGAALARDALALLGGKAAEQVDDPFSFGVPQSSSFRLDWRRDYIPLDAGFSLNAHGHIEPIGYPIVELLAAIGLSHARPTAGRDKSGRRNKLEYRYGVVGRDATCRDLWLSPMFLRAGLGGLKDLPFPMRRFRMKLDWPGHENQARAITVVTEET